MERFPERISLSEYRDKFILKGGINGFRALGLQLVQHPEPQDAEAVKYAEILHLQIPLLAIHRSSGVKAVGKTLAQLVQIPLKNSFQRDIQCRGSHRQPDAGQRKTGCPVSLCPCCSPPTSRFFGLYLLRTSCEFIKQRRSPLDSLLQHVGRVPLGVVGKLAPCGKPALKEEAGHPGTVAKWIIVQLTIALMRQIFLQFVDAFLSRK